MTTLTVTTHEPSPTDTFAPWVEVLVTTVTEADAVTATLWRSSEGRRWPVRGAIRRVTAGGFSIPDAEAGFGVLSDYQLELFNSSGISIGFTDPASVVLNSSDAWLQQPLDPTRAVRVVALTGMAAELSRPTPGERVLAGGTSIPKWIGGRRQGLAEVAVSFLTQTTFDADVVQSMFGGYQDEALPPILLLRTPPPMRIPRVFFADFSDLKEIEVDLRFGGETVRWVASVTESQPPFPGLVKPLLTYTDLDAFYGTYPAMDAAYAGYSERDRDYSLAGYAA